MRRERRRRAGFEALEGRMCLSGGHIHAQVVGGLPRALVGSIKGPYQLSSSTSSGLVRLDVFGSGTARPIGAVNSQGFLAGNSKVTANGLAGQLLLAQPRGEIIFETTAPLPTTATRDLPLQIRVLGGTDGFAGISGTGTGVAHVLRGASAGLSGTVRITFRVRV
ncbi:MAG TPA: hypothetical protein VG406_05615 [Isosphaeraceae bacterium]|jgi:hypothetical protein|nr:hypothetical protein [Isosphaeraceae bacterium]